MTTVIYNEQNEPYKSGHNLAIMLRHAGKRGVSKITVTYTKDRFQNEDNSRRAHMADVRVDYAGGTYAITQFVSISHAVDWAREKRARKGTYWTGCEVVAPAEFPEPQPPRMKMQIVFRKFREGDVIALFCKSAGDCNPGNVMCYQHVGQHGEASRTLGRTLKLATPEEYAPLLRELSGIYDEYEIVPVNRLVAA